MEEKLKQIEEALEWCYGPDYKETEMYKEIVKQLENEQ